MFSDRRQFERLEISDEAVALDDAGHMLGRVSHAGGGGMTIKLDPPPSANFEPGTKLRIVVEEPPTGIRHGFVVKIKYLFRDSLGVEFVSPGKLVP